MTRVGVIAIQGDFAKHAEACRTVQPDAEIREVRTPEDLDLVDRAILPGGESTTVGLLMQRFGLAEALISRAQQGMPLWGTCMGMIIMAKRIENSTQYSLGLLDITVRRNAFGAQVFSFEDEVRLKGFDEPVQGVFIRAPIVTECGPQVEVLSDFEPGIVAVRQGNLLGTSFHPELTGDTRLHEWFLSL